jgi:hypothetical protein
VRADAAPGLAIVGITVALGNRYAPVEVDRGAETVMVPNRRRLKSKVRYSWPDNLAGPDTNPGA